MKLKNKILRYVTPIFIVLFIDELLYTEAYMKSVRIEEIPFGLTPNVEHYRKSKEISPLHTKNPAAGIHAIKNLEMNRSFFHIFKIPCEGKWPFIPPFMQNRVDAAARTLFSQNDSYIKQFCQKWIQIKECFRPNISFLALLGSLRADQDEIFISLSIDSFASQMISSASSSFGFAETPTAILLLYNSATLLVAPLSATCEKLLITDTFEYVSDFHMLFKNYRQTTNTRYIFVKPGSALFSIMGTAAIPPSFGTLPNNTGTGLYLPLFSVTLGCCVRKASGHLLDSITGR
uniref:Uncharacterized protein n=1 Tax=Glossina palpalis gambiensis TaxID=67801 RepID=A0A1B0BN64_9MUSC